MHARASGPFCILKKLGSNAYLLELPPEMSISPVFNVEDLMTYRGTFEPPLFSGDSSAGSRISAPIPPLPCVPPTQEVIDVVMDEETIFTLNGPVHCYLVHWKDSTDTDATWITEDEFRRIDSTLLDSFNTPSSPEASSFQQGGNDGNHKRIRKFPKRFEDYHVRI